VEFLVLLLEVVELDRERFDVAFLEVGTVGAGR
jgi:hypothetical protein